MPENDPISMFCGFPVIVATLPIFDAVATANRYGKGSSRSLRRDAQHKRHHHEAHNIVHEKCGKHPEVKTTAGNSCDGFSRRSTISAFHSKNPTR